MDHNFLIVPVSIPTGSENGAEATQPDREKENSVPERNSDTTDDTQDVTQDVVSNNTPVAVGGFPDPLNQLETGDLA